MTSGLGQLCYRSQTRDKNQQIWVYAQIKHVCFSQAVPGRNTFFFPNVLTDISMISDKTDPDARLNTYTPQSGHVHLTDAASLINLEEHLR